MRKGRIEWWRAKEKVCRSVSRSAPTSRYGLQSSVVAAHLVFRLGHRFLFAKHDLAYRSPGKIRVLSLSATFFDPHEVASSGGDASAGIDNPESLSISCIDGVEYSSCSNAQCYSKKVIVH
jgi:hypothetical protein